MFGTTQWVNPLGTGASGSTTTRSSDVVPAGTPVQASGGEPALPWQVYICGIGALSANAVDVSSNEEGAAAAVVPVDRAVAPGSPGANNVALDAPVGVGPSVVVVDDEQPAVATSAAAASPNQGGARCMELTLALPAEIAPGAPAPASHGWRGRDR